MRDAILAKLKADVPEFKGHVYEPHAIPWTTVDSQDFPYAIVLFGPDLKVGTWEMSTTYVDVLIYDAMSSYQSIDLLKDKVIASLDNKRVVDNRGVQAILDNTGSSTGDQIDDRWQAYYRSVRFAIYPMTWLSSTFAGLTPDPIVGMATWTHAMFPAVSSDPLAWTPNDATPAVYWRVDRIARVVPVITGVWLHLLIRGHVLIPDVRLRNDLIAQILLALGYQHHVVLSNGSWMLFEAGSIGSADVEADPFRAGQITLQARIHVAMTCEAVPAGPLDHVFVTDDGVTSEL